MPSMEKMVPNEAVNKEKFALLEQYLEEEHVLVHVNPSAEGVVLPQDLMANPTTTLKLSHYFARPLDINSERAIAELSFGGKPFKCNVPLAAIWGILSIGGKQHFWPQSAAPEILALLHLGANQSETESTTEAKTTPTPKPKPAPALTLAKEIQVPEGDGEALSNGDSAGKPQAISDSNPTKRPRGGHLRRIK